MEKLKQKVGPLPLYVWGGLVAVAVLGYILYRRHQTSAANTAAGTNTGASTLPASATTGYVMSGDNGSNGWSGYNNNGSPAVTTAAAPTNPGFSPLNTVGDLMAAVRSGGTIYGLNGSGTMVTTNYNASNLAGVFKFPSAALLSQVDPAMMQLFSTAAPTSAATPTATPSAVAAAATAPVTAVNTPVNNTGSPASAIAPSALSGTPVAPAAQPSLLPNQSAVNAAIARGASIFSLNNGQMVPWGGKSISSGYGTPVEPAMLYA